MHRIIRLPEVKNLTGLARSTIYRQIAEKDFPKPISLGAKSVGWLETDVQKWIEKRIKISSSTLTN